MHERLAAAGLKLGQPDERWPRVVARMPMARIKAARLPLPFVQVEVGEGSDDARIVRAPHFMGVTLFEAVAALTASGRVLPEPIVAGLADWALEGLRGLDDHALASSWAGPHSIGASVDGTLVLSLGEEGCPFPVLRQSLRRWTVRGRDFSVLSESFKTVLAWTFSPWSLVGQPSPWVSGWKYAVVPASIEVLLKNTGWADVGYLQSVLRSRWSHIERASEREVAMTLLSAAPEALRLRALELHEANRPPSWRSGGLEVLIDQALENGPIFERFPKLPGVTHEFDGVDVSPTERLAVVVLDAETKAILGETILRKGASRTHIAAPFNCRRNAGPVLVELAHLAQRRVSVRVNATIENGWLHLEPLTSEQARVVDGIFGLK
ncbi:MAG: hypothetical protein QM817_01715 [Archangium sp.]